MTTGRYSLPPNTPWTKDEQVLAKLDQTLNAILARLGNNGGQGGDTNVNIPPGIQTVLASQLPDTFPLNSVVNASVSIVSRLMSNYEDYGVLSVLGAATSTSLRDLTKFWEPNVFAGHTIVILTGNFLYFSQITSNDAHNMFFNALQNNAQPNQGDIYWIIPGSGSAISASRIRWGITIEPTWIFAAAVVAPLAGAVLVSQVVTAARRGYIFGIYISTQEPNNFLVNWVSGGVPRSKLVVFGIAGTTESVDPTQMNGNLLADAGSLITITNVTAGGAGVIYQASLLYAEL